ncbi:AN1-type zinc finger protein 1-like [Ptychodera flava]|uniref:AN1-type zinc finger protein 1-like n=1 Tax=Ptychodera flava TaxID=63121 RepID=UPI003969C4D1
MAELDVGKHCSVNTCKQLDFLPFTCNGCSRIFCLEHHSLGSHSCTQENMVNCKPSVEGPKSYSCSLESCSSKELMPVICEHCQQQFCLNHRHQQDHSCAKYEAPTQKMTKTAEHVKQITEAKKLQGSTKKGGRGVKSKKTAAKVALMKMKMHAIGDKGLPQNERIYLEVLLPLEHKRKSQHMFFSKYWTVGKTVDKIAELADLPNNNNVATAKKLRLFDEENGIIFPLEPSLESLLECDEVVLISGGRIIIEYVDDSCKHLPNPELYTAQ